MQRWMKVTLLTGLASLLLMLTSGIAVAADETDGSAPKVAAADAPAPAGSPSNPTAQRNSQHNFNYEMHLSAREYENPLQESFHNGISGCLLGLGTGIAIVLINDAMGGKPGGSEGRIIGGLTGVGFIGGAFYGYFHAQSINNEIREDRHRIYEKYGSTTPASHKPSFTPTLFRSNSGNLGAGLAVALTLGS